jgi:hypothetical protein
MMDKKKILAAKMGCIKYKNKIRKKGVVKAFKVIFLIVKIVRLNIKIIHEAGILIILMMPTKKTKEILVVKMVCVKYKNKIRKKGVITAFKIFF